MTTIRYDLSQNPYYDRSNNELDKDYAKVLFVSGQRLNAMELNTMQGVLQGQIRKVTDKILTDGSIVSGCSFNNNKTEQICTLNKGEIYLNGYIVQIPETIWHYYNDDDVVENSFPSGNAIIWADIEPTIYTAVDDSTLYNPSENYESFGDTGAHRLKYIAKVYVGTTTEYNEAIKSNRNIVPLLKIYDRECIGTVKTTGIYGNISAEMAQRTYDQSGDFVATGMNVTSTIAQNDPQNKYKVVISAGRCYVQGWQYKFNDNYIICDNSTINTNSTLIQNIPETLLFTGYNNLYYLSHKHVKEVISVTAPVKKNFTSGFKYIDMDTSISLNNAKDLEPVRIVGCNYINLVQGSVVKHNLVDKAENRLIDGILSYDYEIITTSGGGKSIVWNKVHKSQCTKDETDPTNPKYLDYYLGLYPNLNVNIAYKETLSTDNYTVTYDKSGAYIKFKEDSYGNQNIKVNSNIDIHYSWYMPRIDLVYVSTDGRLCVKSGTATDTETLSQPSTPTNSLPLAYITVKPNTDANEYIVEQYGLYRIPIGELQSLKKRIDTIEYNAAMTQLEQQVANAHTEQDSLGYYSLENIYTDPIIDYTKVDTNNKLFDCTIDVYKNYAILPMDIVQIGSNKVTIIDSKGNNISGTVSCNIVEDITDNVGYQRIITSNQLYATNIIDLTPYYCKGLIPTLSCDPVKLVNVEDDDKTITVWMPARIVYNAKYVDTVVSTNKNYTGTTIVTYNTTTN